MVTFVRIADCLGGHIASLLTAIFQIIGVTMMSFFTNRGSIELNLLGEWIILYLFTTYVLQTRGSSHCLI